MKVIRPTKVAPAMLVSSTATETYSAWSGSVNYALNTWVVDSGVVYECIRYDAVPIYPPTSNALYWTSRGPSNIWAMFDQQISTATTATEDLSVTLATGMIDSIALIGVDGYNGSLVIRDGPGGPVIFSETLGFSGDVSTDWYQYFFFDPLTARTIGIFKDLPPYQTAHATITISGAAGATVGLGTLVFGLSSNIGATEYGAYAGMIDYSKKVTNSTTGVTTFTPGPFSKRLSVNLEIDNSQLNRVQRLLYGLRSTPCVWIGADNTELEEAMVVYGFFRDFTTAIPYATTSYCSLEIEGLV